MEKEVLKGLGFTHTYEGVWVLVKNGYCVAAYSDHRFGETFIKVIFDSEKTSAVLHRSTAYSEEVIKQMISDAEHLLNNLEKHGNRSIERT